MITEIEKASLLPVVELLWDINNLGYPANLLSGLHVWHSLSADGGDRVSVH